MRYLILIVLVLFLGCKEGRDRQLSNHQTVEEQLIEINQNLHKAEKEKLAQFVREKDWPAFETDTGLYIWRYEPAEGVVPVEGSIVTIQYSYELLDGTPCYSTSPTEPFQFRVGQDHVIRGLHEAFLLLKVGDKARLVIPSHLAFGLTGDQDKVPPNSALVYDIHLLSSQ
jgi:FKBP-type peptidyl-prolyl cis-trans isomerase